MLLTLAWVYCDRGDSHRRWVAVLKHPGGDSGCWAHPGSAAEPPGQRWAPAALTWATSQPRWQSVTAQLCSCPWQGSAQGWTGSARFCLCLEGCVCGTVHLARIHLCLGGGASVLTWTWTGVSVQNLHLQVLEGSWVSRGCPALGQSSGKPRAKPFPSAWGYRHSTSTAFLRQLRGELFVLPSIIQHLCIIPFYLMTWSLHLPWLCFFFNGI